jgi:hypothetical protein
MIAKSVIANKFYIIEDTTGKIGTARVSDNVVEVYNTEADTITTLSLVDFEKQFAVENQDRVTKTDYATVYGYPTNAFEVFNERTEVNLPVFTKKKNSSVEYAAGYYAFKFEQKGWTRSMCPKLSTMQDYTWTGPYKTEADMLLAIRQNKR